MISTVFVCVYGNIVLADGVERFYTLTIRLIKCVYCAIKFILFAFLYEKIYSKKKRE